MNSNLNGILGPIYNDEPPDSGSTGSGGKTATTASAGEAPSYDEPEDSGSTGSGGKTATTASAGEHA